LLPELPKDHDHSIDREPIELYVADARKFRCRDPRKAFGSAYAQLLLVKHLYDCGSEDRASLFEICVGVTKVAEHIAAAADQLHIVILHRSLSFNRLSRSRMRSTSTCGVFIPVFDFF